MIRALAAVLALAAATAARAELVLGFVEEAAEHTADGEKRQTNLRLGFRREGGGWVAICASNGSPPWDTACAFPGAASERRWTVVSRGKPIAQVTTRGWLTQEWYKSEGLLRLEERDPPRVGDRSIAFGGWAALPVHRPLLAFSAAVPAYRPWTRTAPTQRDKAVAFPLLRDAFPRIRMCGAGGVVDGRTIATRENHVDVFDVLQSPGGSRLIGLRVKRRYTQACDGAGDVGSDFWVLQHGTSVRALPVFDARGFSASFVPVEAGDFDGDGRDEALFWFSGYNEDGYVLFFDDFTRTARFTWGYH